MIRVMPKVQQIPEQEITPNQNSIFLRCISSFLKVHKKSHPHRHNLFNCVVLLRPKKRLVRFMKKGLYALSFGTFGLGIAEFVMMSILPDVAAGFHISLAEAGHLISAYALGVCFGAPLVVIVARNWPLRTILLALVGLFITGNVLMTVSSNYWMGLAARFISGLPHGAYFGVGSIVASRLAEKGKSTSAVATMVMGMTVANLFGVPVGNFLGQVLSWRLVFLAAALWGGVTFWFIRRWVPVLPALPASRLKEQFRFLKRPEPWMLIAATMLGNGGAFCWYSYINPLMTEVSGFPVGVMPFLMLLAGGSMCVGNYLGGHLSDRYTPGTVAMSMQGLLFVSLLLIYFLAPYGFISALLMCVCTGCLFAVSAPQQLLLLQYAPGGEMMGGAMVQLAFNLGNALGAYFGGLPIEQGAGVENTALIGALFAMLGTSVFILFNFITIRTQRRLAWKGNI